MIINFVSRQSFIKTMLEGPKHNTALISINDGMMDMSMVQHHLESVGYNIEDDDVILMFFPDDENGMTKGQAKVLFKFIKNNANNDFLIHCAMGVSRSGAVAKFINDYFKIDDPFLNRYANYNRRVYRQLMAASGDSFEAYKADLMEQEQRDRSL